MEWYVLVLMSAFIFGISEVVKKKMLEKHHTMDFITTYFIVSFAFIMVLLPKVNFYQSTEAWALIILKSSLLAISAFIIFRLLRHHDISEIEPLKNLSPMFLLVIGFLLLGESPKSINILGIALLILGAYVIEADHKIINLKEPLKIFKEKKVIYLLVYLIFISFCAVIDKFVIRTVDIYSYYFMQMMIIAAIFMGIKMMKKGGLSNVKKAFAQDWPGIIMACLLLIVSDMLYLQAIALPTTLIVLVIPIRRLSTFVSALVGGELFHEKGLRMKLTACMIMIAGAWLVVL
ncbi:MAG: EamA family transporter [Nanoarchaeota archaeon]|nr:EamA family transporter [Nanoarchaeota archaeon]